MEIPWVDEPPTNIVRDRVRLSLTPFDGPEEPEQVARVFEHLGTDESVLFSTDYPHWQFDGDNPLPPGLPEHLIEKILVDNPRRTYPRLA
jgi:predicted TIM-barrel fold metal-dependent hydrolase